VKVTTRFGTESKNARGNYPFRAFIFGYFNPQAKSTKRIGVSLSDNDDITTDMDVCFNIPLRIDGSEYHTHIRINSLKDFQPKSLLNQIPSLQPYLEFRDILRKAAKGNIDQTTLNSAIESFSQFSEMQTVLETLHSIKDEAPLPVISNPEHTNMGNLEDLVDLDGSTQVQSTIPNSSVDSLLSNLLGRSKVHTVGKREVANALSLLDGHISTVLDQVIHHTDFQQAERTWRGLGLILSQLKGIETDFSLDIVNIDTNHPISDQVSKHLEQLSTEQLPGVVVIDHLFLSSDNDQSELDTLANLGEIYQIPIVTNLDFHFLPIKQATDAQNRDSLETLLSANSFDKWRSLRNKSRSNWLSVFVNRVLLREPYHVEQNSDPSNYHEKISTAEDLCWGNPVWIFCTLMVKSLKKSFWPTEILYNNNNSIEGLTLRSFEPPILPDMEIPTEIFIDNDLAEAFLDLGMTPILCRPNRDSCFIARAPMTHNFKRNGSSRFRDSTSECLPLRMLSSFLVHLLASQKHRLFQGTDLSTIKENIEDFLFERITTSGATAKADVQFNVNPEDGREVFANITFHMGKTVLNGVEFEFQLPV